MGFEFWSTSFEAPYPSNMDLNIELWVRYYSHQCHLLRKKWFVLFFHRLPNLILGVPPFLRASPTPHVPSAAPLHRLAAVEAGARRTGSERAGRH